MKRKNGERKTKKTEKYAEKPREKVQSLVKL